MEGWGEVLRGVEYLASANHDRPSAEASKHLQRKKCIIEFVTHHPPSGTQARARPSGPAGGRGQGLSQPSACAVWREHRACTTRPHHPRRRLRRPRRRPLRARHDSAKSWMMGTLSYRPPFSQCPWEATTKAGHMPRENAPDLSAVEHWLVTARIASRHHWDMLVFLYRHQTSLVNAEHIARLLGYTTGEVVAALEHLESLGFVARSRVSQGVRLYQCTAPADTPPGAACHQLMRVADSRAVRLLLAKRWRRGDRRPDTNHRYAGVVDREGGTTWRKAS